MRGLILLAVLLVGISAQELDDSKRINVDGCGRRPFARLANNKIVGGQVANVGDWGWQVALIRNKYFICGGSLINSQWILTAGHCVYENKDPDSYRLLIGAHSIAKVEPWAVISNVSKVIAYPKYDHANFKNDIALLKLSNPVDYSEYIIPACIHNGSINYNRNASWASGWGSLSFQGSYPSELYDVKMKVLTNERCKAKYKKADTSTEICAGDRENKDTCQGDSGGPLVIENPENGKWYLHGVTSWGYGCGGGGMYTRVSAFYTWIQRVIAAN